MLNRTEQTLSGPVRSYAEAIAEQQKRDDLMPGYLPVHRWYLRRMAAVVPSHAQMTSFALHSCAMPPVAYYRFLYDTVGKDWLWYEMRLRSDSDIEARLAKTGNSLTVAFQKGTPIGFFELDNSQPNTVELAYFGLMPWSLGQGFGPALLCCALAQAKAAENDVTVNTCSLDHPKALLLYQKNGFMIERQVQFQDPDPRLTGILPQDSAQHIPLAAG